uniref:Carcinoembryonic antigen-related cell adhesion molecule 5-like n=1 Tax=Stegastes partitus TaxID=144197 RepID=A0A3B4ZW41_9TELE
MFTTSLSPTQTPFTSVSWTFGVTNIITSSSGSNIIPPEYEDRITLFPSTGSLELRNLTEADSGEYSVHILPAGEAALVGVKPFCSSPTEPVSSVTVDPKSADLVEFNDSVSLSCTSFGSPTSFLWLNDTSEVTASDRVQFTDGGSVMTIVNVTRFDQQQLRCRASNPVSHATSEPAVIRLLYSPSFGPENTNLMLSPQEENFAVGSNIRLVCSAESRPDAQFMWFLDGDKLDHTERELSLTNIQMNQAGNYSCQTFNVKTLRYQTSQPAAISVMEKISGPSIKSSTNLTVEETRVDLTCEASGSIFTRTWKKDGSDLVLGDNMMLSDNNRLLSFNPVNRKDSGEYSCHISNPVSSDYFTNVCFSDGPDSVQIAGVSRLNVKSTLTLSCSADSIPSASYTWKLNGTTMVTNSAEYIKENVDFSDSGEYTCEARNAITERTLQAVHALTVTAEPVSNVTLSVNETELMEFNSSAVLRCSVSSGSSFSFLWMNGSSEVTATDRVQLTDGGATLTIVNVTRYDQGPFRCCVFNPVSNSSSDSVNFTIKSLQSSNLLSCFSNPPAQLQWAFRGELVNVTDPSLVLLHVSENQSGPYSCLAFNNRTNMHDNITAHIVIASELVTRDNSFHVSPNALSFILTLLSAQSQDLNNMQ